MIEVEEGQILSVLCIAVDGTQDDWDGIAHQLYAQMMGWTE